MTESSAVDEFEFSGKASPSLSVANQGTNVNVNVDVEAITKETYNRTAKDYSFHAHAAFFRQWISASLADFDRFLQPKAMVLILGCGSGKDACFFIEKGHTCILLDYSVAMLEIAKLELPGVPSILADIRWLPFTKGRLDGVWASTCLYHIRKESIQRVIEGVFDTLKPGGLFYLNLRAGAEEKLDPAPRSFPFGGPRFYAFYSEEEVMHLAGGFEVLKFLTTDSASGRDYFQLWLKKPLKS